MLTILGLLVAFIGFGFGLRTDAIGLTQNLQTNENLRTALVTTASAATSTDLAKSGCPADTSKSDTTTTTLGPATCQLKGVTKLKGIDLALAES